MKWKNEYLYFLIFAICFAGFQYLEEVIRIDYDNRNSYVTYLLGVIPNFLPAIGMPCILVLIIKELKGKSNNEYLLKKKHILVILISQLGLIAWEFQQIIAPHGTFDWNDILWTIIGGIIFFLIWKVKPLDDKLQQQTTANQIDKP